MSAMTGPGDRSSLSRWGRPADDTERAHRLERTRRQLGQLAWVLDSSFRVPGTRFRFGLEPIIGLVPGAGDVLGAALGFYIVARAVQHRLPAIVVARMVANTLLDLVIGVVPIVGDVFDFVYRSNSRNMALFERHAREPGADTRSERIFFAVLLGVGVAILLLIGWLLAQVIGGIEGLLRGDPLSS
jgi:hypothetical protein